MFLIIFSLFFASGGPSGAHCWPLGRPSDPFWTQVAPRTPKQGQKRQISQFWGVHLGTIFGIFGLPFFRHFLAAFWEPQKTDKWPKRDPKGRPKWLQNCTFGRPAECELDIASATFGPLRAPQEGFQKRSKNGTEFGTPSGPIP